MGSKFHHIHFAAPLNAVSKFFSLRVEPALKRLHPCEVIKVVCASLCPCPTSPHPHLDFVKKLQIHTHTPPSKDFIEISMLFYSIYFCSFSLGKHYKHIEISGLKMFLTHVHKYATSNVVLHRSISLLSKALQSCSRWVIRHYPKMQLSMASATLSVFGMESK